MIDILSNLLPHVHHYLLASGNGGGNVPALGTTTGGSANQGALTNIDQAINSVTDDAAMVIGPMGALGFTAGALGHTQVFHSPQLKEHSKEIMKYSGMGIGLAIVAPFLVQALTSL